MSKRIRKLERGAADLVTIAVGLTIIAISAIGTSYSLLYGRQALIHQEHYKTALYKLRGFMEEETARVRFEPNYLYNRSWTDAPREVSGVELDTRSDRDGHMYATYAVLSRDPFFFGDDPLTSRNPDYFRLSAKIAWEESFVAGDMGGDESNLLGPLREIKLQSTFIIPE